MEGSSLIPSEVLDFVIKLYVKYHCGEKIAKLNYSILK